MIHRWNASSRVLQSPDGLHTATGRGWALELACTTGSGPVRRYSSVELIVPASRRHPGGLLLKTRLSLLARTAGARPCGGLSSRTGTPLDARENGRGRLSRRSSHTGGAADGTRPGLRTSGHVKTMRTGASNFGTRNGAVLFPQD